MNKVESLPMSIKHVFRKATSDRKHLVVVFSGFRARGTYDLSGRSADSINANILWIEDWFGSNHSYYISANTSYEPATQVHDLINSYLVELGLTKSDCTLVGFSKGGSGALFQSFKFDFPNVIAVAPRFAIASASRQRNIAVFENLLGPDASEADVSSLDSAIRDASIKDDNLNKNVYLISSKEDYQYATEIVPNLNLFRKYHNFSYFLTKSEFVRDHIDVSRYNIQIVLSIILSISDGAVPSFGDVKNGGNWTKEESPNSLKIGSIQRRAEIVSEFSHLVLKNGRIYPRGICFALGFEALTYGSIQRSLVLRSSTSNHKFPLGALNDAAVSRHYYESTFIDYSKGVFASNGQQGIDVGSLPQGKYDLGIQLKHGKVNELSFPKAKTDLTSSMLWKGYFYDVVSHARGHSLYKQSALKRIRGEVHFEVVSEWQNEALMHIEGNFAVVGHPAAEWEDINFFVVYQNSDTGQVTASVQIAKDHKRELNSIVSDFPNDYSKCYFTTPKYLGVANPTLLPGTYKRYVTAKLGLNVFSHPISDITVS